MLAVSSRPTKHTWNTVSFASTLYLLPVLDLLLAEIPSQWHPELRLGLQEALVNAAKHGNNLDPDKTVLVRFFTSATQCWWVISDQGSGFKPPSCANIEPHLPYEERDCGRGLYILYQIFDRVEWNSQGTELRLCKQVLHSSRAPLLS